MAMRLVYRMLAFAIAFVVVGQAMAVAYRPDVLASRPYHLTETVVVPAPAIVLLLRSLVDSDAPEVAAHVLAAFVLFAVAVQASRRITPELRPGRTVH